MLNEKERETTPLQLAAAFGDFPKGARKDKSPSKNRLKREWALPFIAYKYRTKKRPHNLMSICD
jgi:hypothetical protein